MAIDTKKGIIKNLVARIICFVYSAGDFHGTDKILMGRYASDEFLSNLESRFINSQVKLDSRNNPSTICGIPMQTSKEIQDREIHFMKNGKAILKLKV